MKGNKKLYWCSWYQPTTDFRPIQFPPTENILGWWRSGEATDGSFHTLCAWVQANDTQDLIEQVKLNWPEITSEDQFRFIDESEYYKPSDRFPVKAYPWMIERLEPWLDN